MDGDSEFDFDFDLTGRAARFAIKIGTELGREARNLPRFYRGEVGWDELSDLQKNLYLGGDRTEYERIRQEYRMKYQKNVSGNNARSRTKPRRDRSTDSRLFDYDSF